MILHRWREFGEKDQLAKSPPVRHRCGARDSKMLECSRPRSQGISAPEGTAVGPGWARSTLPRWPQRAKRSNGCTARHASEDSMDCEGLH